MAKPGKAQKQASRRAKLAVALRENLKRRKAQARARSEASADDGVIHGENAEGMSPAPEFRRNRGPD